MAKDTRCDVIVIGGGHAGCEAFSAACRIGVNAALVTPSFSQVGVQPCNPAVGGPGKGHLVREVVALGGLMGRVTDKSGIQFRTLNLKKGPAVRSTRVQTDSNLYVESMKDELSNDFTCGKIIEDSVIELLWSVCGKEKKVIGVKLATAGVLYAKAVVITTGTFLRGLLFMGNEVISGGRRGADSSVSLAKSLELTGLPMMRLKTGTCPRIAGDSLNVSKLEEQFGDVPPPFFCPETKDYSAKQQTCFLTYTGEQCHEIIRKNINLSALYGGAISGIGPRYCPSIETKIERFPDKDRHQVFLEPEDAEGKLIYPSGLSTSFPPFMQDQMIRAIPGLEQARIVKYGYAVEYDAVQPQCLTPHLEVDGFSGLFLAGQILGTSGYEEAASLGLIAGANAALLVKGDKPIVLARNQAYCGVMIDDLTGRGVDEPYRMFTSRAEYRLLLREDNANERLIDEGLRSGLVTKEHAAKVHELLHQVAETSKMLKATMLTPNVETNDKLSDLGFVRLKKPTNLYDFVRREGVSLKNIAPFCETIGDLSQGVLTHIEVDIKYSGYLDRQQAQADKLALVDKIYLPKEIDFASLSGLRAEIIEKLKKARPSTLGQVSRIPGITPAAVEILRIYCKKNNSSAL